MRGWRWVGICLWSLSEKLCGFGGDWKRVEGSRYIQRGFHRKDGVVLPFKENLKERHEAAGQNKISMYLLFNIKQPGWDGGTSPAHSLHHMCNETVRDARTGLLCQVEGILQFLNGSYSAATCPPLLLQLVVKEKSNRNDLVCRAVRNLKKEKKILLFRVNIMKQVMWGQAFY